MKRVWGLLIAAFIVLSGMFVLGIDAKAYGSWNAEFSGYIDSDGRVVLTSYKGNSTDVTVPAKVVDDGTLKNTVISHECFSKNSKIKSVKFERGCKIGPQSGVFLAGPGLFSHCSRLERVDFTGVDWSELEDASYMFEYCTNLTTVIGDNWNNAEFTKIYNMFLECPSLESIDLSKLDTSRVYDFSGIFEGCSSLKNVNIKGFNTRNALGFYKMFKNCTSLETVDLSTFEGLSITGSSMIVGYGFDEMFDGCTSLKTIDLSGLKCKANAVHTFRGCSSLESVNLNNLQLFYSNEMFWGCDKLTKIYTPVASEGCKLPNLMCEYKDGKFGSTYYKDLHSAPAQSLIMVPPAHKSIGSTFVKDGIKYRVTYSTDTLAKVEVMGFDSGDRATVNIPSEVNDENLATYEVKSIAKNAFTGNKTIKTVKLANGIEKIGAKAFCSCKNLGKVTLDARTLKSIGKNSFKKIKKKAKFTIIAPSKSIASKMMKTINKAGGAKNGKLKFKKGK